MKARFTLVIALVLGHLLAGAQSPGSSPKAAKWQIPEAVSRRLLVEQRRVYVGFDLGYYHALAPSAAVGRMLSTTRLSQEFLPGLTLGFPLNRRLSLETGLYNLPSTIAYRFELHQTTSPPGGLGIQYAMVPLRLRVQVWKPTRWLTARVHAGLAVAFNTHIRKGQFEQLNAVFPPVWGDTVQVSNNAVMVHNFSPLLEGGFDLTLRLGSNVSLVGYARGVLGVQPLWRNELSYQINQQDPPDRLTLTARANGLSAGLGLRYAFQVGKRYRTVWD
ncbi:MAG: hypothetical protein H7Y12_03620 [Sphingobacteriaceae bacterium]|nr:hypothetical protein [Cytophagaceae bacterium]